MPILDLTPFFSKEKTVAELTSGFTVADLRPMTDTLFNTIKGIVADVTDADVVFVPVDPQANDSGETSSWTLGHVIVHATASNEESGALALDLARGVVVEWRSRYETPWETVTTSAQVHQRLEESHRMMHAMLDAWPDAPHMDTVQTHPFFGELNPISRYMMGIGHEEQHLDQLREIVRQAKAARSTS